MILFYIVLFFSVLLFADQSAIVDRALKEEIQFRHATQVEINSMLYSLRSKNIDRNLLKAQIAKQIDTDLTLLGLLAEQIASGTTATWSCKTNKLSLILLETRNFFSQHGDLVLYGELPPAMQDYWNKPRFMNDDNLQELALKASLILAFSKLNQTINLDESVIAHSTPLPRHLHLNLEHLTFFYNQTELSFVHGGYAFGGQRQDQHYFKYGPFGKRFGPQDCSSWISKLIGFNQAFSTVDFVEYKNSEIRRLIQPVTVQTIENIKPGMIWVTRNGGSGHVNLVLHKDIQARRILVIEYARNLPAYEGFGFRNVSLDDRSQKVKDYWFEISPDNSEL